MRTPALALAASVVSLFAVVPVPQAFAGCTPSLTSDFRQNICIGRWALENNTGENNTAIGTYALSGNTVGSSNTATGRSALELNKGSDNTATGYFALQSNTSGVQNTAIGSESLKTNNTGGNNTAVGFRSLYRNDSGFSNTAIGSEALHGNQAGTANTASGAGSLRNNTGSNNTASGVNALFANQGNSNSAFGVNALYSNTGGRSNTASGDAALYSNTTGISNTAMGVAALQRNSVGFGNTAVGVRAGAKQTGSLNTSIGMFAGDRGQTDDGDLITGSANIAIGHQAGSGWTAGSNNIAIGALGAASDGGVIRIGTAGTQTRAFIAGIFGGRVARKASTVVIDATGQLGTIKSSIRYKEDVHPMGDASSPLLKLRPVTFRYKQADADGTKPIQFGLIAEEVAQAMPELVVPNEDGSPETVAYHLLPSLLLNEYQKQNLKLAAAEARLAEMEKEMAAMKLALSRLASAAPQGSTLPSLPADESSRVEVKGALALPRLGRGILCPAPGPFTAIQRARASPPGRPPNRRG